MLTKKSEDLCKGCRTSIVEFLGGKDTVPYIKKGNEGGSVRLYLIHNLSDKVFYNYVFGMNITIIDWLKK